MDENEAIFKKVLDDEEFRRVLMDLYTQRVYKQRGRLRQSQMSDLSTGYVAIISSGGVLLGVLISQVGEWFRWGGEERRQNTRWQRDSRLSAYEAFLNAVSHRVSALERVRMAATEEARARRAGGVALEMAGYSHSDVLSESYLKLDRARAEGALALEQMWAAYRAVRLLGPPDVADQARTLAFHYDTQDPDASEGYPPRGGSELEERFSELARIALYPK